MNEIKNNILEQELKVDNIVILKYKIEYPEMVTSNFYYGKGMFNIYNRKKAQEFEKYCKTELYKEAKEVYEFNKKNGYPIMVYDIVQTYLITYNQDTAISLYIDQYQFTGGAHGNTIRSSQNWDLRLAKKIPLQNLFPNNPDYLLNILNQINMQIAEQIKTGEKPYFDNYCELVIQNFKTENYYLIPNYMEVFFQQYEIAPYVAGIPTFKIK